MTEAARLMRTAAVAICVAALPQSVLAQTEKPPTDPLCALENERYRVDFLKAGRCCPNELSFWVEDKEAGSQGALAVETRIRQAGMMTLVAGSKLLVTGTLDRSASSLAVVDLKGGALQDELHTVDYRLSPSRSRLVYSRYFGRGTAPETRRPLVLLYDLNASAEANRAGRPASFEVQNAGRPVYPEANARQGSYEAGLEAPHRYLSPFLWSVDEGRIVFFEAAEGRYFLVRIEVVEGEAVPEIARAEVAIETLAPGAPDRGFHPVVMLKWKDDATVELQALIDGVLREAVAVVVP